MEVRIVRRVAGWRELPVRGINAMKGRSPTGRQSILQTTFISEEYGNIPAGADDLIRLIDRAGSSQAKKLYTTQGGIINESGKCREN